MTFEPENHQFRTHPPYSSQYSRLVEEGWKEEIHDGLENIDENPIECSKALQANAEGIRSHRNGDVRILFAYCVNCIDSGHVPLNDCYDCADLHGENQGDPQEVIKLFGIEDITPFERAS